MLRTRILALSLLSLVACDENEGGDETRATSVQADVSSHDDGAGHPHSADDGHGHSSHDGHDHASHDGHDHGTTSNAGVLAATSASVLRFEETRFDVGEIRQHKREKVQFDFTVEGDEPVVISRIDSTCGCTNVGLEYEGETWPMGRPLPANAKARIVGTFESKESSFRRNVTVTVHNNTGTGKMDLAVTAYVLPTFQIDQPELQFGDVVFGQGDFKEVNVKGHEAFTLQAWEPSSGIDKVFAIEELEVEGQDRSEPTKERRFKVSLKDEAAVGRYHGSFIAKSSMDEALLIFRVSANVLGQVDYRPDHRVGFGLVFEGDSRTMSIAIMSTNSEVEIPEPTVSVADPDKFICSLASGGTGMKRKVDVSLAQGLAPGRHESVVTLTYPESAKIESKDFKLTVIVRPRAQ